MSGRPCVVEQLCWDPFYVVPAGMGIPLMCIPFARQSVLLCALSCYTVLMNHRADMTSFFRPSHCNMSVYIYIIFQDLSRLPLVISDTLWGTSRSWYRRSLVYNSAGIHSTMCRGKGYRVSTICCFFLRYFSSHNSHKYING